MLEHVCCQNTVDVQSVSVLASCLAVVKSVPLSAVVIVAPTASDQLQNVNHYAHALQGRIYM